MNTETNDQKLTLTKEMIDAAADALEARAPLKAVRKLARNGRDYTVTVEWADGQKTKYTGAGAEPEYAMTSVTIRAKLEWVNGKPCVIGHDMNVWTSLAWKRRVDREQAAGGANIGDHVGEYGGVTVRFRAVPVEGPIWTEFFRPAEKTKIVLSVQAFQDKPANWAAIDDLGDVQEGDLIGIYRSGRYRRALVVGKTKTKIVSGFGVPSSDAIRKSTNGVGAVWKIS